ncbi:MAG: heme ABC exporter ATP-binding protein CcmA [Chloroflexi bacterium]|nr:heme ABC exporter ATP-binding protein CcmA [Chloroflexota bacterium]MDA1218683.1 heme ABC exporter ATP-binding protein CcmA [Chloroflexota bacterium]PKB57772.1 MAG: heme ABC exporter, ATP-binding protein CcmA [SAR202 cluster bacterium Casp-Chloro-G3]
MSSSQASEAILVEGLHKSYGDWPVLWDLNLSVGWGEFVVLFGANGTGKTTLLRVLSTQARPESGTVKVSGFDCVRRAESVRSRVGVVGHSGFLYEDLTCRENLMFYGQLFRIDHIRQRVDDVLSQVGMTQRADHRVKTLSHGMQKRVAIARAILHQPQVLLLDEPEGGLDQESLAMLSSLLSEWTQAGRTVVMTTHNVELGLSWADRVAVLSDGGLQFQDSETCRDSAKLRRRLTPEPSPEADGETAQTAGNSNE